MILKIPTYPPIVSVLKTMFLIQVINLFKKLYLIANTNAVNVRIKERHYYKQIIYR